MSLEIFCDLSIISSVLKENNLRYLNNMWWKIPCDISRRVGELQKHKILGLFLYLKENQVLSVTTNQIEEEFQKFFSEKSRSTISLYLNQLTKEKVLKKKKIGKEVFYSLAHDLPKLPTSSAFWVVRNFCVFPAYLCRLTFFTRKLKYGTKESERNQILQLTLETIIKNRLWRCSVCQFCQDDKISKDLDELLKDLIAISAFIPREVDLYINKLSELQIFDGEVANDIKWPVLTGKIMYFAEKWKKEIKFLASLVKKKALKDSKDETELEKIEKRIQEKISI